MSAGELGWGVCLVIAVVFGTLFALVVVFSVVSQIVERWRNRTTRRQLQAQLDDARRRERSALNLLAYLQDLQTPFPGDDPAAGSLEDGLTDLRWVHEVERHANTPSEQ